MPAEGDVTSEKAEAGEGEIPYRRGRGGTNLGRAVHAVLQSIDLLTGEGLEDICRAQAEAEGIGDAAEDVLELSRNALATETVKEPDRKREAGLGQLLPGGLCQYEAR